MVGVLTDIQACIPSLRRYASGLLREQQDVDDLVHDTLVRALDRLHTQRDETKVRAWLFAIMHNLFVSRMRSARRWSSSESLDPSEHDALSRPGDQENALRWRDLVRNLNCLPDEQKAVILLVSVEEFSYADVSRVLGVPLGTVMSRLSRGRERLRQMAEENARPCLRRVK